MHRLSDSPEDKVWDIPGCEGSKFYHRVATSLDIDVANSLAAEMGKGLFDSAKTLMELGLSPQHVDSYAKALAAPDAFSIGSPSGIYSTYFQAIALAEICGQKFEAIEAPDGSPLDVKKREHLSVLFKDRSRRTLWLVQVMGLEVKVTAAGNASAAAPSGTSAKAAKTAADAPA